MNSPVRLGVSPAAASTPMGVFNQRFEALFPPCWSPGLCGLFRSPAVPPSLSMHECGATGSASSYTACPVSSTICHLSESTSRRLAANPLHPQLPISAPPSGLDECFFFISLVVRLPYSSVFCQFCLVFVFKLLLSFFWLCEEAQCVYLHLHLGQKSQRMF